jgi:hypothetical protein
MNQMPIWVPLTGTAVALLLGLCASWIASRAIRANERIHLDRSRQEIDREARLADAAVAARRGKLYETLVLTPVQEYLANFPEVTSKLLSVHLPRLETVRNGSHKAVNVAKKEIQDDLGAAWSTLKGPVDSAIDRSGDTTLQVGYREIHHTLIDDVQTVLKGWSDSLLDEILTEADFRPAFARYQTELLRLVADRDPELLYREQLRAMPQAAPGKSLQPTPIWPLRLTRRGKRAQPLQIGPPAAVPDDPAAANAEAANAKVE